MTLCNLQNSTYACNVDNARCVAFDISAALVKQAEKSSCHVIDGEGIDLVERGPSVQTVVIEECISEGFSIGIFWCLGIVEEGRNRTRDSGAKKVGEWAVPMSVANDRTCSPRCVISPPFLG